MKKLLTPQRRALGLSVLALSLASCGSLKSYLPAIGSANSSANVPANVPANNSGTLDQKLISQNLVDAVAQYPRLNPLMATVQVSEADNAFERQVHAEMAERGYKLERDNTNNAVNEVTAMVRPAMAGDSDSALYVLSIGKLSAERHYAQVDGSTLPTSELVIRGGEERSVKLNDDGIFSKADAQLSTVLFKPVKEPLTGEPLIAAAKSSADSALPSARSLIRRNMYEDMESNYMDIFVDYEDKEQSILVFPNDSLLLGETNKRIIEQYVEMMDPATDVLSVIGCSHGNTNLSNGNALLALGRANRVKEAFLFSGIEHDHVLDEGCWAPVTFDGVMPSRGVVLTLKRRKNS